MFANFLSWLSLTTWVVITMGMTAVRSHPHQLQQQRCKADKLTVYRVVLATHWTRETFPKQYPEFRPHAQWSKVVGRSHNPSYTLWRLGEEATKGVKVFAEIGKSDVLEAQSQGEGGIYDEFSAPPIQKGAGRTEAEFFVDGNHSRVSLMSRIIPSPDWFVGVDSLDLCEQGSWVDTLTLNVEPVDAGTDNGFTFTAPNWATSPQEKIYLISAHFPDHPANSFYYPNLAKLPPLATFKFMKVKEYELSGVFYHEEGEESKSAITSSAVTNDNALMSNVVHVLHTHSSSTSTSTPTSTPPPPTTLTPPLRPVVDDVINSVVRSYEPASGSSTNTDKKVTTNRRRRGPRACHVSDWSEWSPCTKTCGIGESSRARVVHKHPRRGGKPCPPLKENKWCGSARACKGYMEHYFNW